MTAHLKGARIYCWDNKLEVSEGKNLIEMTKSDPKSRVVQRPRLMGKLKRLPTSLLSLISLGGDHCRIKNSTEINPPLHKEIVKGTVSGICLSKHPVGETRRLSSGSWLSLGSKRITLRLVLLVLKHKKLKTAASWEGHGASSGSHCILTSTLKLKKKKKVNCSKMQLANYTVVRRRNKKTNPNSENTEGPPTVRQEQGSTLDIHSLLLMVVPHIYRLLVADTFLSSLAQQSFRKEFLHRRIY